MRRLCFVTLQISNIIKRSPVLGNIYMWMHVDSVMFLGDLAYISSDAVCPPGLYASAFNEPNRFSKRSVERVVNAAAYQQFLAECNNTASLTYNVSACWQRFQVDYTVYFADSERQNNQSLNQRRVYYKA